jgi:uncharacterized membrane protein YhaH (DUF805 family)
MKPAPNRLPLLVLVVAGLALASAVMVVHQPLQSLASDFSCFWAGGKAAISAPRHLYDFAYITQLQGWPQGPDRLRWFISPPSALLVIVPFTLAPFWIDYGAWVLLTGALFLWAGLRAGAPWWFILFAPVIYAGFCGQMTCLVGGLALLGLSLQSTRPVVAGMLFGLAAAIKPQLVVFVPLALASDGRGRALISTIAAGSLFGLASMAIFGLDAWLDWISALQHHQATIDNDPIMRRADVTAYATLVSWGLNGAWSYLLAPVAAAAIWVTFRRTTDIADRSIALFGGALIATPYAMNYDVALLVPAVAIYLTRLRDRGWAGYVVATGLVTAMPLGPLMPPAALALPVIRYWPHKASADRSDAVAQEETRLEA